jgi:hypothetical protein
MAEIDFVTCRIALGGDLLNILYRSKYDPVSIPEIDILSRIHGDVHVTDIQYCETRESTPAEEKNRLLSKYSEQLVQEVFPGRNPNMNMLAPDRPANLGVDPSMVEDTEAGEGDTGAAQPKKGKAKV